MSSLLAEPDSHRIEKASAIHQSFDAHRLGINEPTEIMLGTLCRAIESLTAWVEALEDGPKP